MIHHKIIPVLFRQPSTVFQPTGAAGEADHVEPGSVPSSLTCNRPTLASTRCGFAHKIVPNGVQLWRRLYSPLGVPPDDDDDDCRTPYTKNSDVSGRILEVCLCPCLKISTYWTLFADIQPFGRKRKPWSLYELCLVRMTFSEITLAVFKLYLFHGLLLPISQHSVWSLVTSATHSL